MRQKVPQQTEFSGAQGNHAAITADLVPDCIHFDIGKTQGLASQCRTHPAQDSAHARHQFPRGEGLVDIIVGARLQPPSVVLFLSACRQHDDWRSDETTSDLNSLMCTSYAVLFLKKDIY